MAPLQLNNIPYEDDNSQRSEYIIEFLTKAGYLTITDFDLDNDNETDFNDNNNENNNNKHKKRNKSVSFSATSPTIIEYIHWKDYTKKEIKQCWYSDKDKEKINSRRDKIVARLEQGKPVKKATMSYRGLDCWTDQGSCQLEERISRAFSAVMDEQDRQWANHKCDDPDKIAAVSREFTRESQEDARKIALEDEKEAQEALKEFC